MTYLGDLIRMRYIEKYLPDLTKKAIEGTEPVINKCLDVGCGNGEYKELVEKKGYEWVGVDIEPINQEIKKMDATDLKFADKEFDAVICIDVIEEIKDDKKAIKEIYRVLKDGGICLLHTPNKDQTHIVIEPNLDNPAHIRKGYNTDELFDLFEKAGFVDYEKLKIIKTFNEIEAIAWEMNYNYLKLNARGVIEKLLAFNKEFKNLGWLVIVEK